MENTFNKPTSSSAEDLDKARIESLKRAMGSSQKSENNNQEGQNTQGQENNSQNSEKKLDIDQKNSYISEEEQKLVDVFEKQFNKDGIKAVKSWTETTRALHKLDNEYKTIKQQYDTIEQVLEKNPKLAEVIEKAYNGEDIQNFFEERSKESNTGKPVEFQSESKLNRSHVDVSVDDLVNKGYLSKDELGYMSAEQKAYAIRQAKMSYTEDTLPERIFEKTTKQIEEYEKRKQQEKEQARIQEININRYNKGIETILKEFNFDPQGEHKDIYKEITDRVKYIRDPKNSNLISEDAVFLATQATLLSKGIQLDSKNTKQTIEDTKENLDKMFGRTFDANTPVNNKNRPKSLMEKLRERNMENFNREVTNRFSNRKDI
jgi:hypothetical protein